MAAYTDINAVCRKVETPLGAILLAAQAQGLIASCFDDVFETHERRLSMLSRASRLSAESGKTQGAAAQQLERARAALQAYFAGCLDAVNQIALRPFGTPFQLRVWEALRNIPAGTTCSYTELACAIGMPRACRAVAAACGANLMPIIIPCHRVVSANGMLHGYSGGLHRKAFLLRHEAVELPSETHLLPQTASKMASAKAAGPA